MKKQFIRDRRLRYGGITVALTVLIITALILANVVLTSLAERYQWYPNMNETGLFEVTEDCFELLDEAFASSSAGVTEIIFCDLPANMAAEPTQEQLYHTARALAERFPERLKVSCHDILENPTAVRDYATSFDPKTGEENPILLDTTAVILVNGDYHRSYALSEFFSFRDGEAEGLWAYNGEKKLAAGILRAVNPTRPVACLTNNHGEVYFDYELVSLLDDAGYNVTYLDLFREEIPADCRLLVTFNPTTDLVVDPLAAVSERARLEDFLQNGNNAYWLLMSNATPALANFDAFLEEWGVDQAWHKSGENSYRYMVADSTQTLTSDGYTIYGEPTATGASAGLLSDLSPYTVFKNATSLAPAQGFLNLGDGSYQKGNRVMHALYTGGKNAVAWANGAPVDEADSAILMSLTEQTNATGKSYVGVVASVEFAAEDFTQSAVYGNADLLFRTMTLAGGQRTPEGLSPKPYEQLTISTVTTRQMLFWTLTLTLVPAVVVTAIAVTVLVRRRRA